LENWISVRAKETKQLRLSGKCGGDSEEIRKFRDSLEKNQLSIWKNNPFFFVHHNDYSWGVGVEIRTIRESRCVRFVCLFSGVGMWGKALVGRIDPPEQRAAHRRNPGPLVAGPANAKERRSELY
jgi:hypothetical protein